MKKKNIWLCGIMGLVVGDAFGLPVQFQTREEMQKNPVRKMTGNGTFNMPAGSWSDDSSLTLATLESIYRLQRIDCVDIMENFADWLVDGKFTPFGYAYDQGATCTKAIMNYIVSGDVETCGVQGEWANGNGALMRILPVCLFAYEKVENGEWTDADAIEQVHKVSALTHNHLRSQIACGIYYFFVKELLNGRGTSVTERLQAGIDKAREFYQKDEESRTQLAYYSRMFDMNAFGYMPMKEIKSSGYVVDTLEAVVWCLLVEMSYCEVAFMAISLGGDTDTIAAIACGLAALCYGYDWIPKDWLEVLQRRDELEEQCLNVANMMAKKENVATSAQFQ